VDTAVFAFPPITRLHHERTRRIRAVTNPRRPGDHVLISPAADYALAHHVLEGAEAAARARDEDTFAWYTARPDADASASAAPTAVGPRVVLAPDLAALPRSPISETPYYLLGPDTRPAPISRRAVAVAAYALAASTGFTDLLAAHAVVVCLLQAKQLGDTLDSWTITRLPGTVFCDHTAEPAVLARDLIHEAGHNWLNDALTATGCTINASTGFYSPWKQTTRPAFGFLHACWAFPLTMLYTARILPNTSGDTHRFLTAYLHQQRTLLAGTAADHAQALDLVTDDQLRTRLADVHQQAIGL